tara:strand:- start:192 stop:362 length:171 start_codon:yes stop_codon:yes gene_type:complete
MESAESNSYTSKYYYEIANSFYFGKKHDFNPEAICDLNSAVQFYKLAYEKLLQESK